MNYPNLPEEQMPIAPQRLTLGHFKVSDAPDLYEAKRARWSELNPWMI